MTEPTTTRHISQHRFLAGKRRSFGTQDVTIVHDEGGPQEKRTITEAHIQAKTGFFEIDAPIYNGDIVEVGEDPRDGSVDRRLVTNHKLVQPRGSSFRGMEHTHVEWAQAPAPRVRPSGA